MSLFDAPQIAKLPQPVRFLFAGGTAAMITWLVRFPLSALMPFMAAVGLANVIGMVFGFIAYRNFVFPGGAACDISKQIIDFVIVNLLSMIVVVLVSVAFASYLFPLIGLSWQVEAIAHAFGIAAGAVTNFFGHRRFSFNRS